MKLFLVTCRGMQLTHGTAYVVAEDAERAYRMLREDLDARDLGFSKERELYRIELLAETGDYPSCERRLYEDVKHLKWEAFQPRPEMPK